jgi:membrane fusion protein (multidrug efflux system)
VLVTDNQQVEVGQPLVRLDARDYELKREQAQAQEFIAQGVERSARAAVTAAEVELEGVRLDFKRKEELLQRQLIAQQEFDNASIALRNARARLEGARGRLEEAAGRLQEAKARLREAEQWVEYTVLRAAIRGRVTKKNIEPGQLVQAGQPLMALVNLDSVWVVANYKETELTHVRPGQRAVLTVDIYPGVEFHARVDSLQAGTGSRFALLPPENASGNFVKVVQRIPVKLVIESAPEGYPLLPGMSVIPIIELQ